ncbi:MAG TPA: DUF302 domain-containing protein [Anaerolineales bacterium]
MATEIGLQAIMKTSFDEAVEKTTSALKAEGFGVLTRIDMQSTFKEKLGVDFRKYVILGACNPPLAHRSLSANPDVGLLLPCNVTVQEQGGQIAVTAVKPQAMLGALEADATVSAVASEAQSKLQKVIASLNS